MEPLESRTTETPIVAAASTNESVPSLATGRVLRKGQFPWISWGAVLGGLVSGLGCYLLLALFGLAAGLSNITPETTEPVGNVPIFAAIWTAITLILSAFVGGYVAARMSGLSRLADGILHGLVAWGASMLVFAFLITTSVGAVLGGAFSLVGKTAQTVAGGAAVTAGGVAGSKGTQSQLEALLKGTAGGGGSITPQSIANLRGRLEAGDRDGAIRVMQTQMGFTETRATQIVDKGLALYGSAQNMPQQARQTAATAVSGLSKVTWALFGGVLLSLCLGVAGGAIGSKAAVKRRHPLSPSGMAHAH